MFSTCELFTCVQLVMIILHSLLNAKHVVAQLFEALPIANGVIETFY